MAGHSCINIASSPTGAHVNERIRTRSVAVGYISTEAVDPIGKVRGAKIESAALNVKHRTKITVSKVRSRNIDEMLGFRGCAIGFGMGVMISAHVNSGSSAPVHVVQERCVVQCVAQTFGGLGPGKILGVGMNRVPVRLGEVALIMRDIDALTPNAESQPRVSNQDDCAINKEAKSDGAAHSR